MIRFKENIFLKTLGFVIIICILGFLGFELFKFHTMFRGFLKPVFFIAMLVTLYYSFKLVIRPYYIKNFKN